MQKTPRRAFLAAGGLTAVAAGYVGFEILRGRGDILMSQLTGPWDVPAPPPHDGDDGRNGGGETCRAPEALTAFDQVSGGAVGYEISGKNTTMKADPRFIELLNTWAKDWEQLSGLGPITKIWSYGAYTDKCNSWHQAGRAFDIARIEHKGGTISCRCDEWNPGTKAQLRDYWRLAASLHAHFAYTLTHLYNSAHENHIHIDNGVNNYERTRFDPDSRVQVQLIQASLRHVHGQDVAFTDTWDTQTKNALSKIQQRLGIAQPLSNPDGWHAYLQATAAG